MNDFVPFESRVFQPLTFLIFSAREVGLRLRVLVQSKYLVRNFFVVV